MKGRSTLVLLAGVVALGMFIWLQESWRAHTPSKEYRRVRLFDIDPGTLSSLEFRQTNTVVKCEEVNGVWMVGDSQHGMGRADLSLMYRMVARIDQMGKGTTITAKQLKVRGLEASEYGFNPSAIEIIAIDNQGRHHWSVGRATPLGDMVYVMQAGQDDIYTVLNELLELIPKRADQLRDRVLFPSDVAGIRQLEVRGPSGYVRLTKDPSNGWSLQQPVVAPADPQEVNAYLQNLYELRIDDFVAENVSDLAAYGLQGDTRQISLGSLDGSARMLVLGDEIPDRAGFAYARMAKDTSVFALPTAALKLLDVSANDFRDARVLSLPKEAITAIKVKRGTEQLPMQSETSGAWKITSPVAWKADPEEVLNFLDLWEHAVITDFNVANPSSEVEWTLEFTASGSGTTNTVQVLANNGRMDGILVRRGDDPSVAQINLPELPSSIINPLTYKDKLVWNLSESDIGKLSLKKSGKSWQSVERSASGAFVSANTNGNYQVNASAVGKIVSQLVDMKTPEYITYNPKNLDIYGLTDPALELHVGLSDTNALGLVLLVGHEAPEGFYSMVQGRDVVFYLDKPTVDALSTDLVNIPKTGD